jgi:hypothetical protein
VSRFRRFYHAIALTVIVFAALSRVAKAGTAQHVHHTTKTRQHKSPLRNARSTATRVNVVPPKLLAKRPASSERASTPGRADHLAETKLDEDLLLPNQSSGAFRTITSLLNGWYDAYNTLKTKLNNDYDIQYSLLLSSFVQWGLPHGGPGTIQIVYSPTITWNPFTNTAIGSGSFNFAFQGNQFWSKTNTNDQLKAMGLLAPPNDWGANSEQFAQLTYTHTLPGNIVALTIGQYSIEQFDDNEYAGNSQTNFISYPLAQNATQTYANAGVGAYLQITPISKFAIAGGFQEATNVTADTIEVNLGTGKYAYFLNGQWTPSFFGGGTYSFLFYHQPSVPLQPSSSYGYSFSAVQQINSEWGLFARINNASGGASTILTSLAGGVTLNNPFGRNELDRLGLGVARDWTNENATSAPAGNSEWVIEGYYNFTIAKGLQLAPDVLVYLNPALAPSTDISAVFSLRVTLEL